MRKLADITCPVCKGTGGYESYTGSNLGLNWYACTSCYGVGRIQGIREMRIDIKGLSLTQGWASLVAIKAKLNETRSWQVAYRGWIAIHAASKFTEADMILASKHPFRTALRQAGIESVSYLPLGCFVALTQLVAITPTDRLDPASLTEREFIFGNYEPHRFVWHLDNTIKLAKEIPFSASQRLFDVPEPIAEQILEAANIKGIERSNGRNGIFLLCPKCGLGIEALNDQVATFIRHWGCGGCREAEADLAFAEVSANKTLLR